jgi:molybdopterin synthase sulfur carrier subunit
VPKAGTEENTVTLRYFAWVREKAGVSEEHVTLPAGIDTVSDLVVWQKSRGENFAAAFETPGVIRIALDRVHVKPTAALGSAKEIAFFPPVTGG